MSEKLEISDHRILDIALANGFKLKEQPDGSISLHPYVWKFAHALMNEVISTRKAYGYGIVDKDGNRETEYVSDEEWASNGTNALNSNNGGWSERGPFKTVALFYEDSES